LAIRKACVDSVGGADLAELVCGTDMDAHKRTSVERSLEAGTYWVVVDGQSPADQGPFTVDYRVLR
jgi:hypothetical protein